MTKEEAIATLQNCAWLGTDKEVRQVEEAIQMAVEALENIQSAQPEITDCDYCHEDSDGYVTPLEKNCHAFVTYSPIDGWILSLKANGWHGEARIKFCPMCGRRLGGQNRFDAPEVLPSVQPEIIRCRDCKYWREHKYAKETKGYIPFCGFNAIYTKADDFCSRAERRTDEPDK